MDEFYQWHVCVYFKMILGLFMESLAHWKHLSKSKLAGLAATVTEMLRAEIIKSLGMFKPC